MLETVRSDLSRRQHGVESRWGHDARPQVDGLFRVRPTGEGDLAELLKSCGGERSSIPHITKLCLSLRAGGCLGCTWPSRTESADGGAEVVEVAPLSGREHGEGPPAPSERAFAP
jgi:hypothetical protein